MHSINGHNGNTAPSPTMKPFTVVHGVDTDAERTERRFHVRHIGQSEFLTL